MHNHHINGDVRHDPIVDLTGMDVMVVGIVNIVANKCVTIGLILATGLVNGDKSLTLRT
jgi:hypothetical protein